MNGQRLHTLPAVSSGAYYHPLRSSATSFEPQSYINKDGQTMVSVWCGEGVLCDASSGVQGVGLSDDCGFKV